MTGERPTHKVAFSGAGCVGKTALMEAVRFDVEAPWVGFIDEAARVYFSGTGSQIPLSRRDDFGPQSDIQTMAISSEEIANAQGLDVLFTDSSVSDAAVFVASTGDNEGAERLFERVRAWIPGSDSDIAYSRIYVLDPADVPYETDAIRQESLQTHQRHHQTFLDFFGSHGIAHQLLSGTLRQRTNTVLEGLPKIDRTGLRDL